MMQQTPEWYEAKLGKVSASRCADLMAKTKSGYSASRKNYMMELIIARLTGVYPESFTSPAMQWGIETEAEAREQYEAETLNIVEECGFISLNENIGCSPDGLIGEEGLLEIKCPNSATHIETLMSGKVDRKYILQMQFQLWVTGRKWCDFVSYDPRWPVELRLYIQRIGRDEETIAEIKKEVDLFIREMSHMMNKIKELK